MSSFDSITTNFNRMERNEISDKHLKAIYCNSCFYHPVQLFGKTSVIDDVDTYCSVKR